MNNHSEFQVNILSNNRDIRLHLENSKSKKGHNFVKKNEGLSLLLVWVPLLIVNNYSEFQVNIFSNNRDIRKCQSFRTPPPTPRLWQYLKVFFENSHAKNSLWHATDCKQKLCRGRLMIWLLFTILKGANLHGFLPSESLHPALMSAPTLPSQ